MLSEIGRNKKSRIEGVKTESQHEKCMRDEELEIESRLLVVEGREEKVAIGVHKEAAGLFWYWD